jgi:hypothetical protein
LTWDKERSKLGSFQSKQDGTEVTIHRGAIGAISEDDNNIGES